MTEATTFLDQPQIERIRERLWGERAFGRAAVMVGSGFSRNAERTSASAGTFPLWAEIGARMFDALYPQGSVPEPTRRRNQVLYGSSAGAARLANEYETFFGRSSLDDLLLAAIPDAEYRPGWLHEMLMSLPWSDVFTTNYDTLLERASAHVYDRKYDLVLSESDIPAKEHPRIVKLHGSFPSQRPFIVTEEDFRTYPQKFAPFVNLVQQSVMENAFCLIGFSGDDPNFLSWIGWVRDRLGSSAPPIYLCNILNLASSQRRLLESRGVVPVDLSPLFPPSRWPDRNERYAKAFEWLLHNLHHGKPPDVDDWIALEPERPRWNQSAGLPDVPLGPKRYTPSVADPPILVQASPEALKETGERWRRQREEYPGWVIAPHKMRDRLWRQTEYWIEPFVQQASQLDPPLNLFMLYELNWRLEKALVPLFNDWTDRMVPVLESFNPFPHDLKLEEATIAPTQSEHSDMRWDLVAERWVHLAFAVAREAREDQREERFRLWMDRLDKVVDRRPEWRARWFFEEALFHLFRSDQERLRANLRDWPDNLGAPFWDVKRAALLSEVGELGDAERIASESLAYIREQSQPFSKDYTLLSQEGWTMFLLRAIGQNPSRWREEDQGPEASFRTRFRELELYGCNPNMELEDAALRVTGPVPQEKVGVRKMVVTQFDPGREHTSIKTVSGFSAAPFFPGFAFLRVLEEGALPIRCGSVRMFSEAVASSARWIEPAAPLWSLSCVLRSVESGKKEELENWFGRARVATLSQEDIDRMYSTYLAAWVQAVRHLSANLHELGDFLGAGFSERQIKVLSDILSRLSIRLPKEQRSELFGLALQAYGLPLFRDYNRLHECVTLLFDRLLSQAMEPAEIFEEMGRLLSLPIPEDRNFRVNMPEWWPEPMESLSDWPSAIKLPADYDRSSWDTPIAYLTSIVKDGSAQARRRVLRRLDALFRIDALTDEETAALGEALWEQIDESTQLPSDTGYYGFAFLRLPHPPEIDVESRFRRYALDQNFPSVVVGPGTISPVPTDSLARELHGGSTRLIALTDEEQRDFVEWSREETVEMLRKLRDRWEGEKEELSPYLGDSADHMLGIDLGGRYRDWVVLLSETILPKLKDADEQVKEDARTLLEELEKSGICILYAVPSLLYLDEGQVDWATERLWRGLESSDADEVGEAIRGIFLWLTVRARESVLPPAPERLLDEIVNRIVARMTPGLDTALIQLSNLLHHAPAEVRDELLNNATIALRYLLKDVKLSETPGRTDIGEAGPIPVVERPHYRRLSVILASRLWARMHERGMEVPEPLVRWEEVARADTLPEVRRACPDSG